MQWEDPVVRNMKEILMAMNKTRIAVGSYAGKITLFDGHFSTGRSFAAGERPSYLLWKKKGLLYSVDELNLPMHQRQGTVNTWRVDEEGEGTLLNTFSTAGEDPCFLALSPDGRFLLTTNYSSGSLAVVGLNDDIPYAMNAFLTFSGHGPCIDRQEMSHPHSVLFSQDTTILMVVDLGLDRIHRFEWSAAGLGQELAPFLLPPGSGPRMARYLNPEVLVVACELDNTIVYLNARTGAVLRSVSTLSSDTTSYCGHIEIAKDTVIVSNRGENSLALIREGSKTNCSCGGDWPRFFSLQDDKILVANERSDSIVVFDYDGVDLREKSMVQVEKPTCIQFEPRIT